MKRYLEMFLQIWALLAFLAVGLVAPPRPAPASGLHVDADRNANLTRRW